MNEQTFDEVTGEVSPAERPGALRAAGQRIAAALPGRVGVDPLLEFSLTPPDRLVEPDAWVGHIPFAFWAVAAHRPTTLVELGTHSGNSYAAFCQAVAGLGLDAACYAVDTWAGDPQAGFYGEEIYDELRRYHDPRYGGFSRLVRSTFDEALAHFADGTVDLLHIDGYHVYDSVRHDFEAWLPKLSARGLVLFHDVNVRERDFGAWRLWEEISADRPHFTFLHSNGLGVLGIGPEQTDAMRDLFAAASDTQAVASVRRWFAGLGRSIRAELELTRARSATAALLQHRGELESTLAEVMRHRDDLAATLPAVMAEREGLAARLEEKDAELTGLVARAAAMEAELATARTDRDRAHARLARTEDDRRRLAEELDRIERTLGSTRAEAQRLGADVDRLMTTRSFLQRQLEKERRKRQRIRRSVSWRVTRPLRLVGSTVKGLGGSKARPPRMAAAPLPPMEPPPRSATVPPPAEPSRAPALTVEPATVVPLVEPKSPVQPPVRVVAFYLPQFHPISENDAWWGRGFTEWTNVAKAVPQFEGHYQPHLPGELGFYDLRLVEVQQRQVELARLYGIAAFCFYFYWFDGKRLLERPLEQWLAHPELDLEFCLCWANENWTRRWDGKDDQILIGQNHSPEDDLAFIAETAPYLRDPRYLRVDGKPLLLVYRPALLPDARATAERWRGWCRDNGIGEIFLAYTQSFETDPPMAYGFDAAVEFPPNQCAPPDITDRLPPLDGRAFKGKAYDWSELVRRSRHYLSPDFPLFRGVCPAWDNTARRGAGASILANSTPRRFREWIDNAATDTMARSLAAEDRLVFVNAWNEWAEGAHLEPDRRHGYAYLEAMRQGLSMARRRAERPLDGSAPVAVVLHAFYPEILAEILPRLQQAGLARNLFVSCTAEGRAAVETALGAAGVEVATLAALPNHGRDVAPFLRMLAEIDRRGFELLLKLHTKRSRHRQDGDRWRNELYDKLLAPDLASVALAELRTAGGFGIVGPERNVISMNWYKGANIDRVRHLAQRMGVAALSERDDCFVAGTMFYARVDALRPLLSLGLDETAFEPEESQVDGTLAHAIERAISYSALAAGYLVGELKHTANGLAVEEPDPSCPDFDFATYAA